MALSTFGNDLNPVAALIERATVEWPMTLGLAVRDEFLRIGNTLIERIRARLAFAFPSEPDADCRPDGYLWTRTICSGVVPLSPNWRLAPDGTGVRLGPPPGTGPHDPARRVKFEIVGNLSEQSPGSASGGDATCPYSDCGRLIPGDVVKEQAHAGDMGEQLYAVVFKRRVIVGRTKSGKPKEKWVRSYRTPRPEDDVSAPVCAKLDEKLPEWERSTSFPSRRAVSSPTTTAGIACTG